MFMLVIDRTFAHSYEIEELRELPPSGKMPFPVAYIPPPKERPEHDGLWLKISAAGGLTWIGVFAFGYSGPPAITRVVASPDPSRVCVVSRGAGYLVKADALDVWEQIQVTPVVDLRAIPSTQTLVLADFTHLACYGSSGLVWQTPRLCWDDLQISRASNKSIEGTGYDPTNASKRSTFAVNTRTGEVMSCTARLY